MNRNQIIDSLKGYVPSAVRGLLRKRFDFTGYNIHYRTARNPYSDLPREYIVDESKPTVGIIEEFYQYHKSFIAACRDLNINYKLINISSDNWINNIKESGCSIYFMWPSAGTTVWKDLYDNRARIISEDLGFTVYPETKALWLFENKFRTRDWLVANKVSSPQTWIFYDQEEALEFSETAKLPIVLKTNIGASSSGVTILRDRKALINAVKKAFTKGSVPRGHHFLDRDWGKVFLQQYLPNVEEWRMIRIGDSYFGYRKEKVGDFHSGSHAWSWLDPGEELLDFTKHVTSLGNFTSMNVDVFRDTSGNLFVNELQAVFGASTPAEMLKIDGVEGRYVYTEDKWVFEKGSFSKNQCSNLRVLYALNHSTN